MKLAEELRAILRQLHRLTQNGALSVSEQAHLCELTRLLLGTVIALSFTQPKELNSDVILEIEAVLARSLRLTSYLYLLNIADRLNDFLALREAHWFEPDDRNSLIYLHVTLRNLEREIARESHAHEDRERGLAELDFLTETCLDVYGDLEQRGYPPQNERAATRELWSSILDVLNAIKSLKVDLSREKEKFLRQAGLELAKCFKSIEGIARVTHAPLKPGQPSWMNVLRHASESCDAFATPVRSMAIDELVPRLSSVALSTDTGVDYGGDITRMENELREGQLELMALETAEQLGLDAPNQVEYIREDFRLEMAHPGKCVAYIDEWRDAGGQQRLHRRVVEEADGIIELKKKIQTKPELKALGDQIKTRVNEDPSCPTVVLPS